MEWYDFIPGGRTVHDAYTTLSGGVTPVAHGRAPTDAAGNANGPYAHFTENRDAAGNPVGFSTGAGLLNGRVYGGGPGGQANLSSLNANLDVGGYRDSDGNAAYGINANANSGRTTGQVNFGPAGGPGGYVGWELAGPDASANASVSTATTQIGATANVLSGAITGGTRGTSIDEHARIGLSEGVGLAGRVHYGDSDGDRNREYGFGFDYGPLSVDVKTEDPLHAAANAATGGLLNAGEGVFNAVTGRNPMQRSNWTNAAGGALSSLYHAFAD